MTNYDPKNPESIKAGIELIRKGMFSDEEKIKFIKDRAKYGGILGTDHIPTNVPVEAYADTMNRLVDKEYQ